MSEAQEPEVFVQDVFLRFTFSAPVCGGCAADLVKEAMSGFLESGDMSPLLRSALLALECSIPADSPIGSHHDVQGPLQ